MFKAFMLIMTGLVLVIDALLLVMLARQLLSM